MFLLSLFLVSSCLCVVFHGTLRILIFFVLCHFFLFRGQCLVSCCLKSSIDHYFIDADYHGKDMGRERAGPGVDGLAQLEPGEITHSRGALSNGLES